MTSAMTPRERLVLAAVTLFALAWLFQPAVTQVFETPQERKHRQAIERVKAIRCVNLDWR